MLPTIRSLAFSNSSTISARDTHLDADPIAELDLRPLISWAKLLDNANALVPSDLARLSGVWNYIRITIQHSEEINKHLRLRQVHFIILMSE